MPRSVALGRNDLVEYRSAHPGWVADASERGLANWIHDRVWAHLLVQVEGGTRAVWRYSFSCRPAWLAPVAERVGRWVLRRDVERRLAGFAEGCTDPVVLAAVRPR